MQTRQQQDALQAHAHVSSPKVKEIQQDYSRAVYRFPVMVRVNGLQQTIGFYAGKAASRGKGQGEKMFLQHIGEVLEDVLGETTDSLPEEIARLEMGEYLWCTRRCLEVSIWYRRFVESILKIDPTGAKTGDDEPASASGEETS